MPTGHGRFAWHELSTTDPAGAMEFYPQITSWKSQPMEEIPDYTLWTNDDAPLGGVMKLAGELEAKGVPPHWLAYVQVYDLDETVRQAKTLGGEVRTPSKEVPNVGCWAVVADPQGATIGVYEPVRSTPPQPGPPRRGEFSWHELMTTDYKSAINFYRTVFKWETMAEHDMGPMGIYLIYGQRGQQYGGMFTKPPEAPLGWLSYIRVDEVKQRAETVAKLGGKVMNGPMEVPGGDWIVQCADPEGAMFALHTPKPV